MLPVNSIRSPRLSVVGPELIAALSGKSTWLRPTQSVLLIVIDGLGAIALKQHSGHARHLARQMAKPDVALSSFPSTTVAALTSLLTGSEPGEHGLVGYRVRHPETGQVFNQLSGWADAHINPATWQAMPTIFEQWAPFGTVWAVGPGAYQKSGFSGAILRGAQYVPQDSPVDRVLAALDIAKSNQGALVYCYLPEVDQAGHTHGMASAQWLAALEEIDSAMIPVTEPALGHGIGVLITADHGMIDVPEYRKLIIDQDDPRQDGVSAIAGEPRMLHVYLDPGVSAEASAQTWDQFCGSSATVLQRDEALAQGLFGSMVRPQVQDRIGNLVVIAKGNRAFYSSTDQTGISMIGQHGALTPEETRVPLLRLGDFGA